MNYTRAADTVFFCCGDSWNIENMNFVMSKLTVKCTRIAVWRTFAIFFVSNVFRRKKVNLPHGKIHQQPTICRVKIGGIRLQIKSKSWKQRHLNWFIHIIFKLELELELQLQLPSKWNQPKSSNFARIAEQN